MILFVCDLLKFRGGCSSVPCYMQIGVQEVCTLPNPTKESKEQLSNIQIIKYKTSEEEGKNDCYY